MTKVNATSGKVYLIGAGPGDPGLFTLRGVECLRRADVVLYDYLVNPRILAHAPQAEQICLGRHGKGARWTQDEINARLVELARQGKTVARLKGGDPAVFAHGAEETEILVAAGIPFEVVPGITAALAAGSCAGIPITHRELASGVALVTGQENPDKHETSLDWQALARFPGTLVVYMGVTTAPHWTGELLRHGKSPDTPAAIIRRCSLPDQLTIRCRLADVAERLSGEHPLRPPVIVIIGPVAAASPELAWFERRPLFGRRILVTRPSHQADGLATPLAELGAEVLVQPAIVIGEPSNWQPVDAAIRRLAEFQWLVFSSSNGVQSLLDRMLTLGGDLRSLGGVKLAAIGPGTAEAIWEYRLRADLVPQTFEAETLANELAPLAKGQRALLARASRGRSTLPDALAAAGVLVEQIVVYSSMDIETPDAEIAEKLAAGRIDWTTVTSSAIARSLAKLFGENLRRTRLASISPITSATLRELGYEPSAEAHSYTMDGLVEAILTAETSG